MALTHFSLYEAEQLPKITKMPATRYSVTSDSTFHHYKLDHPKLSGSAHISVHIWNNQPHIAHVDITGEHDTDYNKIGTAGMRYVSRHIANELNVTHGTGWRVGGARSGKDKLVMVRLKEETEHDPFDTEDLEEFSQHLREKHGGHIDMYWTHDGHINLQTIAVPKKLRGRGIASAMLEDVKHYADRHQRKIILSAEPLDKSTKKGKLISFYKSHGFVENKGRHKDYSLSGFGNTMYQDPNKPKRRNTNQHAAQV